MEISNETIIIFILFIIIFVMIYYYTYGIEEHMSDNNDPPYAGKCNKNINNTNPPYIIVRVKQLDYGVYGGFPVSIFAEKRANVDDSILPRGGDKFYAFPYNKKTYDILKNMDKKRISFFTDKVFQMNCTSGIVLPGEFCRGICDENIYMDHIKLNDLDAINIATELRYGDTYVIPFITNYIANNYDFYVEVTH